MDNFKNKWNEYKSKVKSKWNKLTSEDVSQINGKRELLLGKLQTRYGWQQKQAEEEVKRFERSLEGERGQKISAEYDRDEEDSSERGYREVTERGRSAFLHASGCRAAVDLSRAPVELRVRRSAPLRLQTKPFQV